MEIIRVNGAPDECVKQIKLNLSRIKNITEFEVYKNDEDIPNTYKQVPDVYVYEGERSETSKTYLLILRDPEGEQEIWVEGATCGYSGSGPRATKDILQLCGIKIDYDLISKMDKLVMRDLKPVQDLNFVVYDAKDFFHLEEEKRFKVEMKFNSARQKYEAREHLSLLGDIRPLRDRVFYEEKTEEYYFRLPYSTQGENYYSSTNNVITLIDVYKGLSDKVLCEIITEIGNRLQAKIRFIIYER